ncbi:MAG TPA: aminoacyl-tRNA hydrolase, partial [Spirochaetota bacterium]|nr:aminoacyl-tRNA hydrolase [Spirochaetota bacterium]
MFVVACLGNPGKKYAKNRHNVGFLLGDYIAGLYRISLAASPFGALAGKGTVEGRDVLIVMPQSYMNNSGGPVRKAVDFYKVPPDRLVV